MSVRIGLNAFRRPPPGAVAALGMFDGVHRGHQRLIATAVRLATRRGGTSVVITFNPDPQRVLDPQWAMPPLMSLETRVRLIQALGVDIVWIIPFTSRFSQTSPEAFVERILVRRLRAACVVVGESFAFGKDRRGNLELLKALGQSHGIRVVALPAVLHNGEPISSSRIRRLVQRGAVADARRLLSRHVGLQGTVVHGTRRASLLGFPTANLRLSDQLLPSNGVYRVVMHCGRRHFHGVMNLGRRPTFGPGALTCEVHLLGFRGTLYGQRVSIEVIDRLRDERRFKSSDALATQISLDVARVRRAVARR